LGKLAAVLLSRQPLRPTSQTDWVCETRKAVCWIKSNGYTLCSSVGMQTWELVTALASIERVPLRLFLPVNNPESFEKTCEETSRQFDLPSDGVEFIPVLPDQPGAEKNDLRQIRDKAVVETADVLIPISVRSGGRMISLLEQSNKNIINQFRVEHVKRKSPMASELIFDSLDPELSAIEDRYLVHWTRGINGQWPGERKLDFYRDLIDSDNWPRSAFETLRRILRMKQIIASSRHMPGNEMTVSFSALSPVDLIPLMRWRARYSQMSFEPYGVGIDVAWAINNGVCQVQYCQKIENGAQEDSSRWLQQSIGRISDWRAERELRFKGDFSLVDVPMDKIILFCHYPDEAELLRAEFGIPTIAFLR